MTITPRTGVAVEGTAAPVARGRAAHRATAPHRGAHRASRWAGKVVAGLALATTVLVGTAALGWSVWSTTSGARLIEFMTGSMTPTYPTGAVAITVPTPAGDLVPGDVVLVRRDQFSKPVTHRVVSVAPADDPAERTLVLQGDANTTPDIEPYVVAEVGRVVAGSAQLGDVLRAVRHPASLALLTLVAGAAVLRAFWPDRES